MTSILELSNIHTYYGESHILQGVDLHIESGQIVCLLGRNGAGKTTTIRSIIGFTPPREGCVRIKGEDVTHQTPERIARRGVGLVPQAGGVFPTLTVRENLLFAARQQSGGWTLSRIFQRIPQIEQRQHHLGGQLSGGERQLVAISRALMTNPDLLMMDEPTEGLSPLLVHEIENILVELKGLGHSILLVEERISVALRVADRNYVMNKGQIVAEATPEQLEHDETIKSKFLGV